MDGAPALLLRRYPTSSDTSTPATRPMRIAHSGRRGSVYLTAPVTPYLYDAARIEVHGPGSAHHCRMGSVARDLGTVAGAVPDSHPARPSGRPRLYAPFIPVGHHTIAREVNAMVEFMSQWE